MRGLARLPPCQAGGSVRLSAPRLRAVRPWAVRRPCVAASTPPPRAPPQLPTPAVLIGGSSALYAAMALGSAGAAHLAGAPPILPSLLSVPPVEPTLTYMVPMLGSLAAALAGVAVNFAPCVEIKDLMERSISPIIRSAPLPGLALLALGAGYGEEAFFRGFLIPVASALVANAGASGGVATAVALGSSSVIFGALHAITPLYFAWATAAGALFGACRYICCAVMSLALRRVPQAGSTLRQGAT
jgi:membrane protease YdiL (CAAX protease family)